MSDATLNPDAGAWQLYELYYELSDTHPGLVEAVRVMLDIYDVDPRAFRDAEPDRLDGVRSLLGSMLEAWSASHGVLLDEAPAVIKELNRLRARTEAKRAHRISAGCDGGE
jgi:hypothetical protein